MIFNSFTVLYKMKEDNVEQSGKHIYIASNGITLEGAIQIYYTLKEKFLQVIFIEKSSFGRNFLLWVEVDQKMLEEKMEKVG